MMFVHKNVHFIQVASVKRFIAVANGVFFFSPMSIKCKKFCVTTRSIRAAFAANNQSETRAKWMSLTGDRTGMSTEYAETLRAYDKYFELTDELVYTLELVMQQNPVVLKARFLSFLWLKITNNAYYLGRNRMCTWRASVGEARALALHLFNVYEQRTRRLSRNSNSRSPPNRNCSAKCASKRKSEREEPSV